MDRDDLRAELLRMIGEEPAAVRFKDALADELHERNPEIPEGAPANGIEAIDEECRSAAEDIRDYLEAVQELRHVGAVFGAVKAAYTSAGENTGEGRRLYRELERLDNRMREAEMHRRELEGGTKATLERLAVLKLAQRKIENEQGGNRTGHA
jgi:hypothetical protein